MSVLPQDKQDELSDNYSPDSLTEALSDYVCALQAENEQLKAAWEQAASQSTMYEGELRKITRFHITHMLATALMLGSLEGIKG